MDLTGEYTIPAPRQTVWDALNDPEILKQCIDGCETLEKTSDTEFTANVTAKVGPVRAKFSGKVTLSEIDAPNGYRISGEGQGGAAGFAKGGAVVKLTDADDGTVLNYEANAEVGGKLASVGSRLVSGVAKKQADDFFGKFSEIVGQGAAEATAAAEAPDAEQSSSAAEGDAGGGVPTWLWVGGIIVVIAGVLFAIAN
jgi:carbon monoxide dehydrogenase subunit G